MRLGRLITAWGIVAVLGYAAGVWMFRAEITTQDASSVLKACTRAKITTQDASSVLKACTIVFTSAFFTLGIAFKIVEANPPKELDDIHQDRWSNLLSNRWKILWVRWAILLLATLFSSLMFMVLDSKLSLIPYKTAIGFGFSSVAVGLIATILSVHEIFHIRKTIQEVSTKLKETRRRQDTLNRLQGPIPSELEKPTRV